MTSNELIGSLQAHEQRLDERSQIKAKEALKSQVSLRREKMSLKIILNQVREVRIEKIEKEIPNQAKNEEEVIFQLKEIINLIYNIIIEKQYGHCKLKRRAWRSNERKFQANAIKGKGKNSKTFLLAYSVGKNENKSTWFLDTIYSSHMCGREEMLSKLDRLLIQR